MCLLPTHHYPLTTIWFPLTLYSALAWGIINVGNSTLVARFHKSPVFLLWVQTFMSMIILFVIAMSYDVRTSWAPAILSVGVLAYLGDLLFFWLLDRLDVSVLNAAWAILAMYMSIVGFVFFQETWNAAQFGGAFLILAGVFVLSFFCRQITFGRTVFLLALLALLYVPAYSMRKAALFDGAPILPVVFWMIFGRDCTGFIAPLLISSQRRNVIRTLSQCDWHFFLLSGFVILCFFSAEFALALAYQAGPVSLISVVGNVQPFFVILIAALLATFLPSFAAKELFSKRSLTVKIGSFSVVFIGLALLGLST